MKTPITEAIEQIKEMYENENITGFSKRAYAQCLDILESKLQKEKEVIEKAVDETNQKWRSSQVEVILNGKQYFNETFTQK
jgi:ATP-dependent protease HslVU (ClpYQ) peptidase subunit